MPQIFGIQNTRKKYACLGLLLISFMLLVFPIFGTVFNGFQYPMYRWTYGNLTMNLIVASIILNEIIKENRFSYKAHGFSFAILTSILIILTFSVWFFYDTEQFSFSVSQIAIIAGFLILWFVIFLITKKNAPYFKMIIFVLVVAELVTVHYSSTNNRKSVLKGQIPYFDNTMAKLEAIKSADSTLFFRVEKQYFSQKTNDALVQEYFGIKSYSSLQNRSYVEFCKLFGLDDGVQIRHLPTRNAEFKRYPILDLLSVKYILLDMPEHADPQNRLKNHRLIKVIG